MNLSISAAIPFYNNHSTLEKVIEGLEFQRPLLSEIIVYDDGSNVSPYSICSSKSAQLCKFEANHGRGFIRNKATTNSNSDLILFCDATNILSENFLKRAIIYFEDPLVAAVSGKIQNHPKHKNFATSWRARHLFKEEFNFGLDAHNASSLTTYGTVLRKSAVLEVGNFDSNLRHSEDKDLGDRLLEAGYKIIGDPRIAVSSIKDDSIFSVLERYCRWYGGKEENFNLRIYWHTIKASFRPMIQCDLNACDYRAALISFLYPHYQLSRHILRKFTMKTTQVH